MWYEIEKYCNIEDVGQTRIAQRIYTSIFAITKIPCHLRHYLDTHAYEQKEAQREEVKMW